MSKRVLWIFALDNRRTVQNSQRPPPQMPRQTPQGTIDNVTTVARYATISVQ